VIVVVSGLYSNLNHAYILFTIFALIATLCAAALLSSTRAFAPVKVVSRTSSSSSSSSFATTAAFAATRAADTYGEEVDDIGNNIAVKNLLEKVQNQRLLSQVAESGLLSKAQAAGITLSKLEPLLKLAASNPEILILVEASGPELLPLLPTIVDLAPAALPILASAVSVPPPLIGAVGVAALALAGAAVSVIPDDSVINIAVQTLVVGLALPVAGASLAGAAFLGQLK
jgi:Protein of unknown function (DUF1118)